MAESSITVAGAATHTNTRTISATTMHDQYVLPGEFAYASYTIQAQNVSIATTGAHLLEVMAGSSLNVRIRRIWIEQAVNATTVTRATFQLYRLSTAGTGGTALTPAKMDTADSASGATAMTLATAKGTETTLVGTRRIVMTQATAATVTQPEESAEFDWRSPNFKSLVVPSGTSNGVAVVVLVGVAAATVDVYVEFCETSFV